jgi:signal transduction histidine kinase
LLVEDSDDDAALLVRDLKRSGFSLDVKHVCAPEELEAALDEHFDIAISDWSMPRITGLDAFHVVRRHDPDLPFIIVSGTISEDIAVDALKAGVDDFMSKGKLARLVPAIERTMRDSATRRRQRKADVELESQRREIARSERLLRTVLDSVPEGVIVADRSGALVAWNPAAGALLDIRTGDGGCDVFAGRYEALAPDAVTPIEPERRALALALKGKSIDRQESVIRRAGLQKPVWISVSARTLRDDADIVGAVAVFRDITQERAAQEQLMISDRMASIGMLAAGVAHEINNPLAAVVANLEQLSTTLTASPGDDPAQATEIREMLADARTAANRVRQIVKDLKVFSRHEEMQPGPVDVRSTLESTLRMAANEIRHRARLVIDYGETPAVSGDESRLGQVFLNLVVNAAQAIPEGHADDNSIKVSSRVDGKGNVVVEVTDTGQGMSAETVRQLFTPFFTTKPKGVGTGLGLVICQRIVSSFGGKIEVESQLGKGTTFRVRMPIASQPVPEAKPEPVLAQPSRRAKVLIVDDEPSIGAALRRVLSLEHDIKVTTQALEALELVRSGERYDVILCDLMMPQMSGMELHAELAALGQADRIVFLTGGAFTAAGRQFLDQVKNPRVEKPFDTVRLRALINELIRTPAG